jgi:hypothetical protein
MKNRVINGAMVIDQRNAGANVSTTGSYPVDRFQVINTGTSTFTAARGSSAPAGFINSLNYAVATGATVGASNAAFIRQIIEGVNGADLGWGTANAQPVTIGFWVRSSLTGTFGFALQNFSANRSYVASYTISAAATWEYKTITIPGDTSGTWNTDTANGWAALIWDLGTGTTLSGAAGSWAGTNYRGLTGGTKITATSGATFYITGVQLEKGSAATSFDYRPYGTELALCQRYFIQYGDNTTNRSIAPYGSAVNTTEVDSIIPLPVPMRGTPTIESYSNVVAYDGINVNIATSGIGLASVTSNTQVYLYVTLTGATAFRPYMIRTSSSSAGYLRLTAELS